VPQPHGVHLRRTADRETAVRAVTDALAAAGGARVGLDGVLADLDRRARVVRVPASAAHWGFTWDAEDGRSTRWWPQGVTTSADHDTSETYDGRRLVLTSWYSKRVDGVGKGSRISVVDLSDARAPRYRHVLLVEAVTDEDGRPGLRPLRLHAGGLVWHGPHLHVASTARGIAVARLDDIVRVGDPGRRDVLGLGEGTFGYRYLLPVRFTYDGVAEEGHEPMRYSFLSLGRSGGSTRLVAGEYGRRGATTRLVELAVDPTTMLLGDAEDGVAHPRSLVDSGIEGMQGVAVVDGRWYVSASAGRYRRGSLHVGRPGAFARRPRVLPVGVEDLAYWPSRDELWSLAEYPGRRYVFAVPRARVD
jgi:hypothetical protein